MPRSRFRLLLALAIFNYVLFKELVVALRQHGHRTCRGWVVQLRRSRQPRALSTLSRFSGTRLQTYIGARMGRTLVLQVARGRTRVQRALRARKVEVQVRQVRQARNSSRRGRRISTQLATRSTIS